MTPYKWYEPSLLTPHITHRPTHPHPSHPRTAPHARTGPGIPDRTYTKLADAAAECLDSRVFAGAHWRKVREVREMREGLAR